MQNKDIIKKNPTLCVLREEMKLISIRYMEIYWKKKEACHDRKTES